MDVKQGIRFLYLVFLFGLALTASLVIHLEGDSKPIMTEQMTHPYLLVFVTLIATLCGKYVWDRWLSQSSRVTGSDCLKNQKICRDSILLELKVHDKKLDNGEDCFNDTRHIQRAVLLTLLSICNHLKIPCDVLTKVMVDNDILK